jgi:hypothetical protein
MVTTRRSKGDVIFCCGVVDMTTSSRLRLDDKARGTGKERVRARSTGGAENKALACVGGREKSSPGARRKGRKGLACVAPAVRPATMRAPLLLCSASSPTVHAVACVPVVASKLGFGCVQVCLCFCLNKLCQEKKPRPWAELWAEEKEMRPVG